MKVSGLLHAPATLFSRNRQCGPLKISQAKNQREAGSNMLRSFFFGFFDPEDGSHISSETSAASQRITRFYISR
jgi:hypothetical protein